MAIFKPPKYYNHHQVESPHLEAKKYSREMAAVTKSMLYNDIT